MRWLRAWLQRRKAIRDHVVASVEWFGAFAENTPDEKDKLHKMKQTASMLALTLYKE